MLYKYCNILSLTRFLSESLWATRPGVKWISAARPIAMRGWWHRCPMELVLELLEDRLPHELTRDGTLAQWLASGESREEALYQAHTAGANSMTAIARALGLSVSRVSRLIARAEVCPRICARICE